MPKVTQLTWLSGHHPHSSPAGQPVLLPGVAGSTCVPMQDGRQITKEDTEREAPVPGAGRGWRALPGAEAAGGGAWTGLEPKEKPRES